MPLPYGLFTGGKTLRVIWKLLRGTAAVSNRLAVLGITTGLVGSLAGTSRIAAADDHRTLSFFHTHTNEAVTVTYRRNGHYDEAALNQLNWLLRDWRVNEPVKMDPRLFDIIWQAHRDTGSRGPVHIISAYRSPQTNGMLRHRSKAVSEHSQHMSGKAMDIRLPDVPTARLREVAMQLQGGGVGFYVSSAFVHIDTGSVRAWPRMSQQQLARLFPDGKTVHLPSNGGPLARYEQARAEILARGGTVAGETSHASAGSTVGGRGLWATLFSKAQDSAPPAQNQSAPLAQVADYAPVASKPALTSIAVPLPPPRPRDIALARVASADGFPSATGAVGEVLLQSGSPGTIGPADGDEHTPLRHLFRRVAEDVQPRSGFRLVVARTHLRDVDALDLGSTLNLELTFLSQPSADPGISQFTGPAVRPLPVLREHELPPKA